MSLPAATVGIASSAGRRSLNEDSVLAQFPIYAVADGMGGHEAGEVASALAVRALAPLAGRQDASIEDVAACLARASDQVREIHTAPGLGAGTTVSGVCLTHQDGVPYWLVFNVGDSRTYLLSEGALQQVSVDHSEAQEMVDAGRLAPEEVSRYRRRNVITRALGAGPGPGPDFWLIPLGTSDRVLMCTDGLSGEVSHDQLQALLLASPDPQRTADQLVAEALQAGGRDNVSALVVDAGYAPHDADTLPRSEWAGMDEDTIPTEEAP